MSETRTIGYSSPDPIAFAEIDAWSRLTGVRLSPAEVSIIRRMDSAALAAWHKRSKQPNKNHELPDMARSVAMTDVAGVSSLMKSFRARAKEAYGKQNG